MLMKEKNGTQNKCGLKSLVKKVSLSPAWCDHLGFFQQDCSHTSLTYDRQSRPSFKAAAGPNMAISFPSAAVYQCHSGSTMQNLSLCLPPSLTLLLSLHFSLFALLSRAGISDSRQHSLQRSYIFIQQKPQINMTLLFWSGIRLAEQKLIRRKCQLTLVGARKGFVGGI